MSQYECNFCSMGQYNRAIAWRIVKDLSRKELKELLKLKNATKKTL